MNKNKPIMLFLSIVLTLVLGCAKKPDAELISAREALRAAQEAGAQDLQEYKDAEELIKKAEELMNQGKYKEARDLLLQARAKAEEAKRKAELAKGEEKGLEELRRGIPEVTGLGIQDIFFDFDRYNIRADAVLVLEQNAKILKDNPDVNVVIEGYCDIRGTEEYNLALGQRRAEATKNYLVRLGVSPTRIQAVSRGETTQWAEGTSEDAYQQNRRAHFIPTKVSMPSM
jgi:peptidoglycan-associated lipoprotein